jgi:hypothetical protein
MKRKILYMSLGAVFTLIVGFSLISLADENAAKSNSSSTSQSAVDTVVGQVSFLDLHNGKFIVFDGQKKHEFLINAQTVIMKNNKNASEQELQLGDPVKVLLNSSGDVRYVVINQDQQSAQSSQELTPNQVQIRSIPAETSQTAETVQPKSDSQGTQSQSVPNSHVQEVANKQVNDSEIDLDLEHEDHGKHKGWFKEKEKHKKHDDKNEHEQEDD